MSTNLRYYDHASGKRRFKPRYVWAAGGFVAGLFCGLLLTAVV